MVVNTGSSHGTNPRAGDSLGPPIFEGLGRAVGPFQERRVDEGLHDPIVSARDEVADGVALGKFRRFRGRLRELDRQDPRGIAPRVAAAFEEIDGVGRGIDDGLADA